MEYPKTPETERLIDESVEEMKRKTKFLASLQEDMFAVLSRGATNDFERQTQKSIANYYAVCIYNGSRHFVHGSRNVEYIANAIHLPPKTLLWLSRMPAWKASLRFWGYTGDPKLLVNPPKTVPVPLQEVHLIQEVFQKYSKVRFATYTGFIDTIVKHVQKYELLLDDGSKLKKIDVILAFPQDRMSYVKKGIKRRKSVADLELKPIPSIKDRSKVNVAARIGDNIECVMRNGLVVTGENIWISKYNIVMRVGGKKDAGGKVVLLYRHALYGFRVLMKQSDPTPESGDDFDTELNDETAVDAQSERELE